MFDIVSKLRQSPAVRHLHVIDLIDEASAKYLRCRADIVDGSTLHISESSIAGSSKYSYHWQNSQNQLIVRWDNAPHYSHLASFPHHRHESGSVHECHRLTIDEVLEIIEKRLRISGTLAS